MLYHHIQKLYTSQHLRHTKSCWNRVCLCPRMFAVVLFVREHWKGREALGAGERNPGNHGDFLVLYCTVLADFSTSKKQRLWVPTTTPSCLWFSATFHFLWFAFLLFFFIFFYKLPINFINLPKIGPVRYWLSMSDEFGKHQPSCNAIFTQ